MLDRRHFFQTAALGGAALASVLAKQAVAQTAGSSTTVPQVSLDERLNEPGPEARFLEERVGLWDVKETVWASPASAPDTSTGLVAERMMIGSLLQEFLRPPSDTARSAVKRIDFLCYNRLDGRWDYVSFDARDPVGLMPAWSTGRGSLDRIEFSFMPLAVVVGLPGTGEFLRMRQVITSHGPNHDVKDQYFTLADGSGVEWLAHRYDYTRRA